MRSFLLLLAILLIVMGVILLAYLKFHNGKVAFAPAGYKKAEQELNRVLSQEISLSRDTFQDQEKDLDASEEFSSDFSYKEEVSVSPMEEKKLKMTELLNSFYEAYSREDRLKILEELMTPPQDSKEQEIFLLLKNGSGSSQNLLLGPLFSSEATSFIPEVWQIKDISQDFQKIKLIVNEKSSKASFPNERERRIILVETADNNYKIEAYLSPTLRDYPKYSGFFTEEFFH